MDSLIAQLVSFIFPLAGTAIPALIQAHKVKKINREWEALAARRNLRFTKGKGQARRTLRGTIEGYRVRVQQGKKWRGKDSGSFTRYELDYPAHGSGFKMVRALAIAGSRASTELPALRTGDDEFDRNVLTSGEDSEEIVAFLTPERRAEVLRLFQRFPASIVRDGKIEWRQRKAAETAGEMDEVLVRFLVLARRLSPAEEGPPPARTAPLPAMPVEPERGSEAVRAILPDPPAPVEDAPAPAPEEEPAREPSSEPARLDELVPIDDVCAELFGESRMGSETERIFAERCAGRRTQGTGILRRIEPHARIPDGGDEDLRQAILELPPPASRLAGRAVRVLIPLPEDDAVRFRTWKGKRIAFAGRLLGCNPYLRDLYVQGTLRSE